MINFYHRSGQHNKKFCYMILWNCNEIIFMHALNKPQSLHNLRRKKNRTTCLEDEITLHLFLFELLGHTEFCLILNLIITLSTQQRAAFIETRFFRAQPPTSGMPRPLLLLHPRRGREAFHSPSFQIEAAPRGCAQFTTPPGVQIGKSPCRIVMPPR